MNRLGGIYTRLEISNSKVTPAEVIILLRDLHLRIKELENGNLKEPASDRRGVGKVSEGKVSPS
jgi:hypothetical protein